MAGSVTLQLDRRFSKVARGKFHRYDFEVGVLQDESYNKPLPKGEGLKSFAGGEARKVSRTAISMLSEVSEDLRKRTGINFYTEPFRARRNRDIIRFANAFMALLRGGGQRKRVENLLQAIVRNPILRGDYGVNSPVTERIKGFNRYMIDTGQLFRSIKARTRTRSRVSR